jgi:DMSO/TMAO reductase YedYZ heme-binding membrane subunit
MTFIFILLAKSIKKHPAIYYFIFALPALLFIFRQVCSAFDWQVLTYPRGSVFGQLLREYVHVSGFAYPLLIIIMFAGALPASNPYVKRIMMIRKELSIISGFPILIHSWVRLRLIPGAYGFFFGEAAAGQSHSGIGAVLTNSAYLLGIVMVILFIMLWVTSFDAIHKMLGAVRWKKIQRWSYVLYAMLFIHSVLLSVSRLIGGGGGHGHGHGGGSRGSGTVMQGGGSEAVTQSAVGSDINYTAIIALASTCIVFITYLILRLRKAKKDTAKRLSH